MRQHCHSRKGFAISADCRSPEFSDANLALTSAGGPRAPEHGAGPPCELAAEVLRRGMQLLDIVDAEVENREDCLDRDWRPELPEMPEDRGSRVRSGSLLSWLLGGGDEAAKIRELCGAAQEALKAQPVVSEVPAPAKVFGDIHGQLRDLLLLFHFYGRPGQLSETVTSAHARSSSAARGGFRSALSRSMTRLHPAAFRSSRSSRRTFSLGRTMSAGTEAAAQPTIQPNSSFGYLMQRARTMGGAAAAPGRPPPPAPVSYVFNGDWVDRGRHQLEVVVLLFALKIVLPGQVFLNRGNHEDRGQNVKTSLKGSIGFDKACLLHFHGPAAQEVFEAVHETFDWLPLATRIDGRILVLHGGLGRGDWTLDMLRSVERPVRLTDMASDIGNMVYNTLWSDPLMPDQRKPVETFGVHSSHRTKHNTLMKSFGRDVTESFCKREGIDLIIRSHQFKQWGKGYELMHDGLLLRVFSARNYCGAAYNDGGILLIGRDEGAPGTLLVRPQNVERMAPPRRFERAASGAPEPYCPSRHLMHFVRPRPPPACLSLALVFKPEVENVECNVCGAEELELGCYYSCRGCSSYDVCTSCASQCVGGVLPASRDPASAETEEHNAQQDSDGDCTPISGPTLLTAKAARGALKPA